MSSHTSMGTAAASVCLVLCVFAGCSNRQNPEAAAGNASVNEAVTTQSPRSAPSALTMQRWSGSCALCHASGVAGAPRVGNTEEWAARIAKGQTRLLQNTVEGFNKMPPLGYCMSCEADDFVSMIEFMAGLAPGDLE